MKFHKASRQKAKLRLALTGPSGSGKTYGALQVAKGIGGRIAVIDTERGSASLYSHLVEFDALELDAPYKPERFIEAIQAAEAEGYEVLIIDSITHEWSGVGGCLEMVDEIARSKYKGNSWSAWNEVTPRHRAFIDAILQSKMHIIATTRSKTETAQTEENGRKRVVKLGMKSEQRDGIEYEFTTVLDIVHDGNYATASKDRTGLFGGDPRKLTPDVGVMLLEWLNSGAEVTTPSVVEQARTALDAAQDRAKIDRIVARAKAALGESSDEFSAVEDYAMGRIAQLEPQS
ncbi:MAG: ATP-binding protein [Bradyrhizobium sp.]|nr:ATP-binding protein [Bradyrhizobium sp.]